MSQARTTAAKGSPPDRNQIVASLPAIDRLLEAAAEWLEGINEVRRKSEEAAAEGQAALGALAATPEGPSLDRERESDVTSRPFNPQSLVGSWFHRLDANDNITCQGSVVADVAPPGQPGIYLCELHQWKDGGSAFQELVSLSELCEPEDGGSYRFYDHDEWMRMADRDRQILATDSVNRQQEVT
jgi:hypothetical protein